MGRIQYEFPLEQFSRSRQWIIPWLLGLFSFNLKLIVHGCCVRKSATSIQTTNAATMYKFQSYSKNPNLVKHAPPPPHALFVTTRSLFQPPLAGRVRRDEAPPAAPHRPCSASGRASIPPSRGVLPDPGGVGQRPQLADPPDVPAGGGAAWRRLETSSSSPMRRATQPSAICHRV